MRIVCAEVHKGVECCLPSQAALLAWETSVEVPFESVRGNKFPLHQLRRRSSHLGDYTFCPVCCSSDVSLPFVRLNTALRTSERAQHWSRVSSVPLCQMRQRFWQVAVKIRIVIVFAAPSIRLGMCLFEMRWLIYVTFYFFLILIFFSLFYLKKKAISWSGKGN